VNLPTAGQWQRFPQNYILGLLLILYIYSKKNEKVAFFLLFFFCMGRASLSFGKFADAVACTAAEFDARPGKETGTGKHDSHIVGGK
jgi:hypothetical protein